MDLGPPPAAEETLEIAAGVTLHLERFAPSTPASGAAVVVHGFSSHCGLYRHLAGALATAGLAVTTFDCRGHGRSSGRRGYVRRFSDFRDDLALVIERTRAGAPDVPLALVGHSHGATIVMDTLLAGRSNADALVLAAPYLRLKLGVPTYKRVLSPVMGRLWPTLAMDNELRSKNTTRNPDAQRRIDTDPLVHHVATPRWFNEVRAAQTRILAGVGQLRTPTFMLVGTGDRVVDNDAALTFAQGEGPLVETKQYEGLFHELFLEPERDVVIRDIVTWLENRAPRNARGETKRDPYT